MSIQPTKNRISTTNQRITAWQPWGRSWVICGLLLLASPWPVQIGGAEPPLPQTGLKWKRLAPLPEQRGLAAAFAGVSGKSLLVGGGANFPHRPPWEGGKKVWHDRVWALTQPDGEWREVGKLPKPLAYGVSIGTSEGLVCIGGSDAEKHYSEVFRLSLRDGKLVTAKLPALPRPVANACGARLHNTVYVAGGSNSPQATQALGTFFALDLVETEPRWRELERWPGAPRMLAVAAAHDEGFYLISGVDLSADSEGRPVRKYLKDAYRYRPGKGWLRIADVPRPVAAAPSPAPILGAANFLILGGDDGSKVGSIAPENHPGFSDAILAYDAQADAWSEFGKTPAPRVTAPSVAWGTGWVVVSGEVRPGVRSSEVWRLEAAPR